MTGRIPRSMVPGRGGGGSGAFPTGILPVLLAAMVLLPFAIHGVAAQPIQVVFGADIPLGGTASGTDLVYLFLTGPNLPAGGISLAGGTPVATGDPASFTRVEVRTDGTWAYTWSTPSVDRILDPGTYVVYIVEEPRALPDLDDVSYATQAIVLGGPAGTLAVPARTTGTPAAGPAPETPVALPNMSPAGTAPPPVRPAVPQTTSPGRLAIPPPVPLAAAALAFLGLRWRG